MEITQTHSQPAAARNRSAWQGRTVLVTGISGFVGGWLAKTLVDAGAEVVGIAREHSADPEKGSTVEVLGLAPHIHLITGSVDDFDLVQAAVADHQVDAIFHLAAQTIVGAANRSPVPFFHSNIEGTWNILEAARTHPHVSRVVIASSDKAYGEQVELPYTESTTLNPLYPYDASKACADLLARAYATTYDLPIVVTRCANIYGGADLNWSRLVPGTVRSLLRDETPVLRSDGTAERDYIYVEDAVRAYLAAGECADDPQVRGKAYNFGSGKPVSARAMVEKVIQVAGRNDIQVDIRGKGKLHGEISRQYLDSRLAHQTFGWHPRTDLTTGIRHTLAWYHTHAETLGILQLA